MAGRARRVGRVVAAAMLAAAAYAAVPAAPAAAATCATAGGVTVVVDFNDLGGGVQSACVPGGGGDKASSLFPAAGFGLDYVQRQPGFVCRVGGKPDDNPCVNTPPADAYWGLWWSDGKSGRWTYATSGVGGQTVPDGGSVAFSWNGSDQSSPPSTSPAVHAAPIPTPTQQPTTEPTRQPGGSSTQPSASSQPDGSQQPSATTPGSASASESASASKGPSKSGSPRTRAGDDEGDRKQRQRSSSASPDATDSPSAGETEASVEPASADPPDVDDGGLPAWVAPVVVLVLFGAAGAVAVVRRRTSGPA